MDIANRRKMTKLKRVSTAPKTNTKWNLSQPPTGTPATGAEESGESKMDKSKKPGLRALNDLYIIEEDPMDVYHDSGSGLTSAVTDALKSKKLFVPDAYENFSVKFPCSGVVLSIGNTCQFKKLGWIKEGSRVIYARLGVQRYKYAGKTLCDVREIDLHAILD